MQTKKEIVHLLERLTNTGVCHVPWTFPDVPQRRVPAVRDS